VVNGNLSFNVKMIRYPRYRMIIKNRANVCHVLGGGDDKSISYECRSGNDFRTNCERICSFIHNFRRVVIMYRYS
jgi:hypothetical protein